MGSAFAGGFLCSRRTEAGSEAGVHPLRGAGKPDLPGKGTSEAGVLLHPRRRGPADGYSLR